MKKTTVTLVLATVLFGGLAWQQEASATPLKAAEIPEGEACPLPEHQLSLPADPATDGESCP